MVSTPLVIIRLLLDGVCYKFYVEKENIKISRLFQIKSFILNFSRHEKIKAKSLVM